MHDKFFLYRNNIKDNKASDRSILYYLWHCRDNVFVVTLRYAQVRDVSGSSVVNSNRINAVCGW